MSWQKVKVLTANQNATKKRKINSVHPEDHNPSNAHPGPSNAESRPSQEPLKTTSFEGPRTIETLGAAKMNKTKKRPLTPWKEQ